jgi:hypothetical protein
VTAWAVKVQKQLTAMGRQGSKVSTVTITHAAQLRYGH